MPSQAWTIIDEVGDGACLLRAIARRALNNPNLHHIVRQQIVSHIHDNQDQFYLHVSNGFGNDQIQVLGSGPRLYNMFQQYLQIMSLPPAYAGNIEIAAASNLYGLTIEVVVGGTPFPS
ncbi:unnamed protein product, partial [Scytosiphon promiscuus]